MEMNLREMVKTFVKLNSKSVPHVLNPGESSTHIKLSSGLWFGVLFSDLAFGLSLLIRRDFIFLFED